MLAAAVGVATETGLSGLTFAKVGAAQFQNRVKNQLIAQPFYYVDGQWLFLMSVHNGATDSTAKEYLELSFRVGGVGGLSDLVFSGDEKVPVAALLVAVNLAWTGAKLVRHAAGGLLDEEDPTLLGKVVEACEATRVPGVIRIHRLRAQRSQARLNTFLAPR